jgi:hypothetical protein
MKRGGIVFGGVTEMKHAMLEEIWRVREELVKRHGGVHGYVKHLQALDRERIRRTKQKRSRRAKSRVGGFGRVAQGTLAKA